MSYGVSVSGLTPADRATLATCRKTYAADPAMNGSAELVIFRLGLAAWRNKTGRRPKPQGKASPAAPTASP